MYIDFGHLVDKELIGPDSNMTLVNDLILSAQSLIERWTGRIFESRRWTSLFNGGTNRLYVQNPILKVLILVVFGRSVKVVPQTDFGGYVRKTPILPVSIVPLHTPSTINTLTGVKDVDLFPSLKPAEATIVNRPQPLFPEDAFFIQFDDDIPRGESIAYSEMDVGFLENGKTPAPIAELISRLVAWQVNDPTGSSAARGGRGLTSESTDGHRYVIDAKIARNTIVGDSELDDILRTYTRDKNHVSVGLA